MKELMTKSLAQLVSDDHRSAAVLEKYHLDFCCKGKRSLEQACGEKGIKIEDVVAELEAASQKNLQTVINYNELPLGELTDVIISIHHSYVKKEMPLIMGYLQRIAAKHGERHPEMMKVFELFAALKEEMERHMQKEEVVLFPRIKEMERQSLAGSENKISITYLQGPINVMEQEHDQAGNLLAEIRELTNNFNPPADACNTYRLSFAALQAFEMDLHQHVHLENNILFPRALSLFKNSLAQMN